MWQQYVGCLVTAALRYLATGFHNVNTFSWWGCVYRHLGLQLELYAYYGDKYNAPSPLGLRSGLIAVSMFPFMFSMALKFNLISILTGISHAHLQIFHQATSILVLTFILIHVGTMINRPLRIGGMQALKEVWYKLFSRHWSGAVAAFFMLWICLSSFGLIRKMSYEFFVVQHITSVVLFLAICFVHLDKAIDAHG